MARPYPVDIEYGPETEVDTPELLEGDGEAMGYGEDIDVGDVLEDSSQEFVIVDDEDGEALENEGFVANEKGALAESLDTPFDANLVLFLDDDERNALSDELVLAYDMDKRSRKEWEETYQEGLDLLGLKIENRTCPWDGAFGAHHPLLTEAVVKFQSECIVETFPAQGPVKTKILGDVTREREASSVRVREDMNHMLTDEMKEYRSEHERLLFSLPIAGSAFKKIWFDATKNRPCSQFVPAEDFIASYGITDLWSAGRYTHRMKKTANEVLTLQIANFYDPDIELEDPVAEQDEIEDAKNEYTGLDANEDTRHTILEMHVDIDLIGFEDVGIDQHATGLELPYVVHIEKTSGKIMAIYRNWAEGDLTREKRIHFAHYTYIPGFGFYGLGLIHLIGGFTKGATAIMRQLVDAGTLSNLPGGYKTRGFRIVGGDHPIAPGEFRDTDVATGTLKENIMPLPFKEPSIVLFELLKGIVEEGRRFAAVSDVNIADMQPNSPVGSTLAILERTLKTMTAIQARVHAAMKHELQMIKDIVSVLAPEEYDYDAVGITGPKARKADYSVVEIIPVSDPNASTMSQRIVMYQAALQLMQMNPSLYDEPLLHRSMLEVLGMKNADKLVPDRSEVASADPVTENMNILNGAPVRAEPHQNHEAHIAVLVSFMQDPQIQSMIQQQGPGGNAKMAAATAHLNEHIAFVYRAKIEKAMGQRMPTPEQQLPPEQEYELAGMVAQAAGQVLQTSQQEAAQQQEQEQQNDPLNIIQREELNIKAADQALKEKKQKDDHKIAQGKLYVDAASADNKDKADQEKLQTKVMEITQAKAFKVADLDAEEFRGQVQDRVSQRQAQTARRQQDMQDKASRRQAAQSANKPQEKKE